MMPVERTDGLDSDYRRVLWEYLETTSEAALAAAYELGRRALAEGVGVIDWATVHQDALAALGTALESEAAARAGTFFREALSPFEMTQRGYAETNRWLERLNRDYFRCER